MPSSKDAFILQFGLRRVLVLREQCLHYSDVLALGLSTFASLRSYNIKSVVILGGGRECPWDGNLELTEKTWEAFRGDVSNIIIVFRSDAEQLEQLERER